MSTYGTAEGPYRATNHKDNDNDVNTFFSPPSSPPMKKRWSVWLFGKPFRPRQFNESTTEYRVAQFANFYKQRRTAILGLLLLSVVMTAVYMYYGITSGTAGLVIGELPPLPYTRDTMAARATFAERDRLVVYALPSRPRDGKGVRKFNVSRSLETNQIIMDPRSEDHEDMSSVMRHATVLLDANSIDKLPCVCAPLVGYCVRMVVIRGENDSAPLMMVNPTIHKERGEYMLIRHTMSAHFNIPNHLTLMENNTSDVMVLRRESIDIIYDSIYVRERRLQIPNFTGAVGYCLQECMDLLDGKTIWHRAYQQLQSGVKVNEPWRHKLRDVLAIYNETEPERDGFE